VSLTNQDYESLLTEVINEVNAVRNKYDAFSQFTEAKVAQYVLEQKSLSNRIDQLTRDLAVTNAQRAQIQAELVALNTRVEKILMQRDKARNRVKFLEATRTYRLEQKLRSLVPQFLRSK
jgi:chromosome segregation ATPase